ncbi:PH domain-containing protein [Prochlorococcus sp. MIT 1307]|uniref:PH domain-containing protein n=1 Tax=Prochlorococcus sp. MIT 1307 TaxID=3096219 RepID=UPI002A74E78C|nr:PH domain-containing protein [Prochlorococcus sp. MIT 1307]
MKNIQEEIYYEGGPAKVDLIINLIAGLTLVGLPFAFGAVVRALWLRYKITQKRVSITGGWFGRDQSQVVYNQIKEIRSIPRGFGFYGDMVLFLKDGAKLEMRSVPSFRETENFILKQMNSNVSSTSAKDVQGFAA